MDKVSELDVRLLNALDTDFDALYEASNKMLKLIDKASKDMEYILGLMEEYIKVIGKMDYKMVKVKYMIQKRK